jgi:hypothetical protein
MSRARSSYLSAAAPILLAMVFLFPSAAEGASPALELRDGGKAAFSLQNAKPGSSATGCLVLTYSGSDPALLRLYGKTVGTGFDRYLKLVVTRGSSCARFRRESIVYDGTLRGFPDDRETAIRETWSPSESHAYRFHVSVRDDNAAQGLRARQTFTWTAEGDLDAPASDASDVVKAFAPPFARDGLPGLLRRIARVAAEVGKRSAFPSSLLVLVLAFLSLQNRIDRRDPKLALAPVYPTPDLAFDPPLERGGTG